MELKQTHKSKYIAGALIIILTLLNVIPAFTIEIKYNHYKGGYEKSNAICYNKLLNTETQTHKDEI
ncbi:MAG: hypothetical protein H7844_12285 [Nitrospirae bacterium YQR-1]